MAKIDSEEANLVNSHPSVKLYLIIRNNEVIIFHLPSDIYNKIDEIVEK